MTGWGSASACCRYKAEETPNVSYVNTHKILHNLREQAKQSAGQGPRVLIAGPTDSGKSTICKMLLNWAVRSGHQATYIDLDIGGLSILLLSVDHILKAVTDWPV